MPQWRARARHPAPTACARSSPSNALDLEVAEGEFFGLLGPNGAGKTTTIGILTTRTLPTGGQAFIGGHDVVRDAVGVRRLIGVVPQRPNPDRGLTVRENLVFHAAYFGIARAMSLTRADELLDYTRARRSRRVQGQRAVRRAAAEAHDRARTHPRAGHPVHG